MVDDDGRRQGGEKIPELGQVDRLEINDDMPAEPFNAAGDLHQFVLGREVDETLDEIEAHAAHAGLVEPLQFVIGDASPNGRDAPRPAAARQERVDHGAIVGAVAGRLNDDVAGETQMIAQREQFRLAGVAGRVFALGRVRELGPRSEHVAMRVDAAGGYRKRGLLGPSYQSSQPLVFSNGPVTGLAMAFIFRAFSRYI